MNILKQKVKLKNHSCYLLLFFYVFINIVCDLFLIVIIFPYKNKCFKTVKRIDNLTVNQILMAFSINIISYMYKYLRIITIDLCVCKCWPVIFNKCWILNYEMFLSFKTSFILGYLVRSNLFNFFKYKINMFKLYGLILKTVYLLNVMHFSVSHYNFYTIFQGSVLKQL